MKEKLLRILKYVGIGFGGLVTFTVLLAIVFPDTDNISEPVAIQQESTIQEDVQSDKTIAEDEATPTEYVEQSAEASEQRTHETQRESDQTDQQTYYTVTSVVDGDTIKINMDGTIKTLRLIGIDTPETVDPRKPVQCFGVEASNKAKELLSGKQIRIEPDPTQDTRDKYGRLLVYVYRSDGLFFNRYMIEQGYAYEYTYETPYKYQSDFKTVQQLAQSNQRGLWSSNTCGGNPNTGIETESDSQTSETNQATVSNGKYYTSSYHTAKYYYPEDCSAWEGLSQTYLKSFNTLEELLATYYRTLSPQCE